MRWGLIGMAGGLIAGWTLTNTGPTVLAFPALAGFLLAGVILDELGRARPARDRAVALVEVRRLRDYLPRPATEVASALAAVVIGGLAIAVLAGFLSAPDHSSSYFDYAWHGPLSEEAWPGRGMPALVFSGLVTAALAVLAAVVLLHSLVRAPRAGVDAQARERDEQWRRRVASTLIFCLGWTLSIPLAFFGFLLSTAMPEHGSGWTVLSLVVTTFAVAGLFTAGWYGHKLATIDE